MQIKQKEQNWTKFQLIIYPWKSYILISALQFATYIYVLQGVYTIFSHILVCLMVYLMSFILAASIVLPRKGVISPKQHIRLLSMGGMLLIVEVGILFIASLVTSEALPFDKVFNLLQNILAGTLIWLSGLTTGAVFGYLVNILRIKSMEDIVILG